MHFVEKCTQIPTKKLQNISCPTELIKTASFLKKKIMPARYMKIEIEKEIEIERPSLTAWFLQLVVILFCGIIGKPIIVLARQAQSTHG